MKECKICGSTYKVYGEKGKYKMNLCDKHRYQMDVYGFIKERTSHDNNKFIVNGDVLEIYCYNKDQVEICKALTDSKHYDLVKGWKWHMSKKYIEGHKNGEKIFLHRLVTNCPKGMDVDHINHNCIDNREINLRVCTHQQNTRNRTDNKINKSGYMGVLWNKGVNKWISIISIDGKNKHLGCFKNIEDAIKVRRQAEEKYYGEFACPRNN